MTNSNAKSIYRHGDTLNVVRRFARSVRTSIGSELYLLQIGEQPVHCKPVARVGRGVWEIRVKDNKGAFRVFYAVRRRDGVHVLHVFQQKTQKIAGSDIDIAKTRYRDLQREK